VRTSGVRRVATSALGVANAANVVSVDTRVSLVGSMGAVRTSGVVVGGGGGVRVLVEDVLNLGLDLIHGSSHDGDV